ncbi:dihydroorotate dehydrogenase electron transfer subunit [Oscillospiraceae bacterium OttesenSCG-928-G22]|nr:dihydroorotate dehydrogenase electron transfer subunit [Oscillospiraceae bacterium OttesenSCG-928-G22]
MLTSHLCAIQKNTPLNEGTFELLLDAPGIVKAAAPGQFVHIKCEGFTLRRPISICDAEGGTLRLLVDRRGKGTAWLSERKAGETLDVLGPLGNGFDVSPKRVLLAGGGIGVFPLLFAAKKHGNAAAALGFQSADKILLRSEFEAVASLHIATDDGSYGRHGFVDAVVRDLLDAEPFDAILACGPTPMLRSLQKLSAETGVPLQLSLEERMGCGVGACLVCACKTKDGAGNILHKHVCKDGPIFPGEEVCLDG